MGYDSCPTLSNTSIQSCNIIFSVFLPFAYCLGDKGVEFSVVLVQKLFYIIALNAVRGWKGPRKSSGVGRELSRSSGVGKGAREEVRVGRGPEEGQFPGSSTETRNRALPFTPFTEGECCCDLFKTGNGNTEDLLCSLWAPKVVTRRSLGHNPGNDILQSRAASQQISHLCHLLFATCRENRDRVRDRGRKRDRMTEENLPKTHFFVVALWRKSP